MAFTINGTSGINLATQPLTGSLPDANAPSGSVLQVVSTAVSSAQSTSSTSFVKHTGLVLSITPISTNSKIYIVYNSFGYVNANTQHLCTTIYRNSTNLGSTHGFGDFYTDTGGYTEHYTTGTFLDSPNTTSAIEYAVYFKTLGAYTAVLGDSTRKSVITAMEISG